MSVNNLRRRKLRTGLTVLGVVIGTASIVVMVSLGIGLKEMTVEQYASYGSLTRIQVYQSYGMGGEQTEDSFLVDDTVLLFQQIPHVEAVSPQLSTYINMRQGIYTGSTNLVGLSRHKKHMPNQMSGGQQQRVGVARALVADPAIIFADEPTGNLDSHTSEDVMRLMRKVVQEQGKTLVMVTHDDHLAEYADRVFHIIDGKIVKIDVNTPEICDGGERV